MCFKHLWYHLSTDLIQLDKPCFAIFEHEHADEADLKSVFRWINQYRKQEFRVNIPRVKEHSEIQGRADQRWPPLWPRRRSISELSEKQQAFFGTQRTPNFQPVCRGRRKCSPWTTSAVWRPCKCQSSIWRICKIPLEPYEFLSLTSNNLHLTDFSHSRFSDFESFHEAKGWWARFRLLLLFSLSTTFMA